MALNQETHKLWCLWQTWFMLKADKADLSGKHSARVFQSIKYSVCLSPTTLPNRQ